MKALLPNAEVAGSTGRSTSFEVVVDGRYLAYSKLKTKTFPEFETLAEEIADFADDKSKVPAGWQPLA